MVRSSATNYFFFVDYLGARYHTGGSGAVSVFSQAMRNGDFSALLAAANPIQLYDPENNFAPFINNQNVPIVNPVAKFLFAHPQYYPLPNATPTDGIVKNNLQGPTKTYKVNNQGDIKLEYDLNQKDKGHRFLCNVDGIGRLDDGPAGQLPRRCSISYLAFRDELGAHLFADSSQLRASWLYSNKMG